MKDVKIMEIFGCLAELPHDINGGGFVEFSFIFHKFVQLSLDS